MSVSLVWNHSTAPFSRMGSILIEIMHFNVLQNPCDLHNSKTINTTDVQSALYIIQLCFTHSKYNLWYILVHQPAFGIGLSAYRQSKQSKCNLQNPNTNETIQMQSTESFLAQLFCHKGGGGVGNTTPHCTKTGNCTIQIQSTKSKHNLHEIKAIPQFFCNPAQL